MRDTPLASQLLTNAMALHGWQQADLAKASGLDRATVSLHLTNTRAIRDDHLAAYITALDPIEQTTLVAAWLRDTLPAAACESVLDTATNRLSESVRTWRPTLAPDQQKMLDWLAAKLATDPELADIFAAACRKGGYSD